jgi:Mycothiol maleylpyruvate isomerase N-terminal domain
VPSVDVTREQAARILEDGHARIGGLLASLSEADLARRGTIGGGGWSAKDLAGHLSSWEEIAVGTLDEWNRGSSPWIESVFATQGAVDRLNQENVEAWMAAPVDAVLERFERSHRELLEAIRTVTEREWGTDYGWDEEEPTTLGTRLGQVLGAPGRLFGHVSAHMKDLEAYVRSTAKA